MTFRLTLGTRRIVQQILLFGIVLAMLLAHNSLESLNVRLMMVAVAIGAGVVICSRGLRDSNLLNSPLDYGWLPFVLLTGITVLTAQSPRRSLEDWLWLIAIQLPVAYGTLYIFRRRWPERGLARAILGAGAYFYGFAVISGTNYLSQWLADRSQGVVPPGFRLFGIMNHPNIFAMFIAITAPLMLGYLFVEMKRPERVAVIMTLVVAAFSLFGTGSRTGLVSAIVGVAAAFALSMVAHPSQPLMRFRVWVTANRRQAIVVLTAASVVLMAALGLALYLQFGRPYQDNGGGRISFFRSALTMFAARPLDGYGPGGFVENEILTHSVPPYHILPHAHDMILNTAAESGLLGLVGFIALLLTGAWTCIAVWRRQPSLRPYMAGPIGGLIAFSLFGTLDSPINQFGPFFLATALLGYVAAGLPAPEVGTIRFQKLRTGLIVLSVWGVVVLGILVLIPYSVLWNIARPDRLPSEGIDPLTAARQLDSVLTYDSTDPLVTFQSAYSWANSTSPTDKPDSPALQNAIARFERGLQLAPNLAIHYLNLSALYRQAGRAADSASAAQRATEKAAEDPINWLNLGLALENADQSPAGAQRAVDAYLHALQLEPRWATVGFWQGSAVRQQALASYAATPDSSQNYYALLLAGDAARSAGNKREALTAYQDALKITPGPVAQVLTQGLVALAKGDTSAAHGLLTDATDLDVVYHDDQLAFIDAWLRLGDLARDKGDQDTMLRSYTIAYSDLTLRGLDGFGSKGDAGYAITGYSRYGRITDYLPGVVIPDITPDQIPRFRILAQAVLAGGNKGAAIDIYDHILEANPNDSEAKVAMACLASGPSPC